MKSLKTFAAAGIVAASAALTATDASAFTIDFTDDAFWNGTSAVPVTNTYTALGGFDVTLEAFGGDLDFSEGFDGGSESSLAYCDGFSTPGPLDCDSDGGGVNGDEITLATVSTSQWITATFTEQGTGATGASKALKVTGLHFLDLFKAVVDGNSVDAETADVFFSNGTFASIGADKNFQQSGGYRFVSTDEGGVTSITFAAGPGNDDNGDGDYAVAGINVVPLPAAAWLLLGVSGGLIAAKLRSARKDA